MELEIIKTILTDLLEEQKTTNQLNQEVVAKLKELEEKVNAFEQKLETVHVTPPPVDVLPVQKEVSRGLWTVAKIVEAQPNKWSGSFGYCYSRKPMPGIITRLSSAG